jgi:sulfite exporter TauE/SafE
VILPLLARAAVLGLSTGLFCVGFCVPLLGPVMLGRDHTKLADTLRALGLFLGGRLVAYLLFGLVFGLVGAAVAPVWQAKQWLLPAVYALLGVLMIAYGLVLSLPHVGLCRLLAPRVQSPWYLAALGFLAGLNLCPPFLLAVTTVIDVGGALRGMLFFFVFFLATSVYLVPLVFAGFAARLGAVRTAARAASVVAGAWFVFLGLRDLLR